MRVPISVLYLPTVLKCKLGFHLMSMTDKPTCDTHLQSKYIGCCSEYYFTAVTWVSVTEVSVVWMNRLQNLSLVTVCKSPMWFCQEVNKLSLLLTLQLPLIKCNSWTVFLPQFQMATILATFVYD